MFKDIIKGISLLGSTGSIGQQTLEVVDWFPDNFKIVSLAAYGNIELLAQQVKRYQPKFVVVYDENRFSEFKKLVPSFKGEILSGMSGLVSAATAHGVDVVLTAVSGVIGLIPTIKSIEAGKDIALANKETLVAGGALVMDLAQKHKVKILPVDSEHSAIFQCLEKDQIIDKILLTASGGPFRQMDKEKMKNITPAMALKHPTWRMGPKITIDSATMMNKGLEVIEARWLFDVSFSDIQVLVHPQSIIHSMVQYEDGSILAHLGKTDMRIPIQYALTYPRRFENNLKPLNFFDLAQLTFEPPDIRRFPALKIAYEAGEAGGTYPTVMNAANEVLVEYFLQEKITYGEIPILIDLALSKHQNVACPTLEDILESDQWARTLIGEVI